MAGCNNAFLIIDPVEDRRRRVEQALQALGRRVIPLACRNQALRTLYVERASVIVTAGDLPDGHWQDLLSDIAPMSAAPRVVVLRSEDGRPSPAEASQLGAFAVLADRFTLEEARRAVEAAAEGWQVRRRPHVLAIDDEPMILHLIASVLEPRGIKVSGATDGRQAVELLKANADIAVAILDSEVGHAAGERILDCLRALRPGLQAIVVSGEPDVESAFGERRVRHFFSKPFNPAAFATEVSLVAASSPRVAAREMRSSGSGATFLPPLRKTSGA
jgi:DNA-binding NtrC family response regulator